MSLPAFFFALCAAVSPAAAGDLACACWPPMKASAGAPWASSIPCKPPLGGN